MKTISAKLVKMRVIAMLLFVFTLSSCGTSGNKNEPAKEQGSSDTTQHNSGEHPEGEHPAGEHPTDGEEK